MNRWLYLAVVIVVPLVFAALGDINHQPLYSAVGGVVAAIFTHPMGIIGQLLSFPLIYTGIATPAEAAVLAAPAFAVSGYIQWYVLLPRLARRLALVQAGK